MVDPGTRLDAFDLRRSWWNIHDVTRSSLSYCNYAVIPAHVVRDQPLYLTGDKRVVRRLFMLPD